jgi:hypothetical protein
MSVAPAAHLGEDRFLCLSEHLGFFRQAVAKPWDAAQDWPGCALRAPGDIG